VADIVILQLKPIQKEIGLTEDQRAKMNAAADEHRQELSEYQNELEKTKGKPQSARLVKFYDELKVKVLAQLSPSQIKRLGELSLQHAGVLALGDRVVADKIGMSAKQLKDVRADIVEDQKSIASTERDTAKPILEKYKGKKPRSDDEAQQLRQQIHNEVSAAVAPKLRTIVSGDTIKMLGILTPAQRKKFESLQGKRFQASR
jgi:Spy/CpxP family protein refolding chaperone